MLKQVGTVQRNDLSLRIEYTGLETEIYQIDTYKFIIYCINYKGNFKELLRHFDYSIRQVGTNVVLSEQRPTEYLNRIDNIPLLNVVNGFKATCVTESDLDNFIRSKFYDVDIARITIPKRGIDLEILIEVSEMTGEAQMERMRRFLLNVDLGTDKITVRHKKDVRKGQLEKDLLKPNTRNLRLNQNVNSFEVMQLSLHKELPFTIAEADFWFERAEDIYTGKVTRNELSFYREDSLKCYLDFSVFDNIDLRNVLLLYDTVYRAF